MRSPTTFERRVWAEVQRIRWGETKTYGEVARAVGSGSLATGTALSRLERFRDMEAVVPWRRVTKARYGGARAHMAVTGWAAGDVPRHGPDGGDVTRSDT